MSRFIKFLPIILLAIVIPLSILAVFNSQDTRSNAQAPEAQLANEAAQCSQRGGAFQLQGANAGKCMCPDGKEAATGKTCSGQKVTAKAEAYTNSNCAKNSTTKIGNVNIGSPLCVEVADGTREDGFSRLLAFGLRLVYVAATLLAFAMLLWGGISYILAQGDAKAIASARLKIIYALVGLGIVAISFVAFLIIGSVLGFNLFSPTIGDAVGKQLQQFENICKAQQDTTNTESLQSCVERQCNARYSNDPTNLTNCLKLVRGETQQGLDEREIRQAVEDQVKELASKCTMDTAADKIICARRQCNMVYPVDSITSRECKVQVCRALGVTCTAY